jgi:hypothetical protein
MIENIELDEAYELVKHNKVGWREERIINNKRYLIFVRPDGKGTEVVFRELLTEKQKNI